MRHSNILQGFTFKHQVELDGQSGTFQFVDKNNNDMWAVHGEYTLNCADNHNGLLKSLTVTVCAEYPHLQELRGYVYEVVRGLIMADF